MSAGTGLVALNGENYEFCYHALQFFFPAGMTNGVEHISGNPAKIIRTIPPKEN